MKLVKAQKYLQDVIEHKDIIPFRRYRYGVGRKAQAKKYGTSTGRWPEKSCKIVLGLLQNAHANAKTQSIDADEVYISHIQVNKAPVKHRRTHRAHGRVTPYLNSPCHIEMIVTTEPKVVKRGNGEICSKLRPESKLKAGASA